MLEDAVSGNFVHCQSYISVSTPNKTEDKILLWRTNVMIVRTLLTSLSHSSPTCPPPWAGWPLVSPYQLLTRQHVPRNVSSLLQSTLLHSSICQQHSQEETRSVRKSKQENCFKQKPFPLSRVSAPVQNLDMLKVGLNNDLGQDQRFERMLQAALNQLMCQKLCLLTFYYELVFSDFLMEFTVYQKTGENEDYAVKDAKKKGSTPKTEESKALFLIGA